MPPNTMPNAISSATSRIRVPEHVVYRSFASETVVLNLQTGKYHGLNATAGSMLEALGKAACVRDAATVVAGQYAQPQTTVEQDMRALCGALIARGLIELDDNSALGHRA